MLFLVSATIIFAQTRNGQNSNATKNNNQIGVSVQMNKAIGDTLCYFDGSGFFVNPTDQAAFGMANDDVDGLTVHQSGWTSDWMGFYSVDPLDFQPNDVDSAFFIGASSWFDPAGQSDNWFSFGPITTPATGMKLTWAVKCNPGYRDGYKVWVSATGMANYTDFTGTPIFVRADEYPSTTEGVDTVWTYYTVDIPISFNGGPAYIGFQHYAMDMDVLFLDEFSLVEAMVSGIENTTNNVSVSQNYPNPVMSTTAFSYTLAQNANVTVEVFDITGRLVMTMNEGNKAAGTHQAIINAENLNSGSYFYTLTAGDYKTTKNMVVVK